MKFVVAIALCACVPVAAVAQTADIPRCYFDTKIDHWMVEAHADPKLRGREIPDQMKGSVRTFTEVGPVIFEGKEQIGRPTSVWFDVKAGRESMRVVFPTPSLDFERLGPVEFLKQSKNIDAELAENPFELELLFANSFKLETTDVNEDFIDIPMEFKDAFETNDHVTIIGFHTENVFEFTAKVNLIGFKKAIAQLEIEYKRHQAALSKARRCIDFDESIRELL